MTPVLLSLLTAALFGANVHVQRMALADTDPATGALLSVGGMAALFWAMAPVALDPAWFATRAALIFAGVGLFFPALGQTLQIAAVRRVGPALTSVIGSFTPFFAILLAVALLGETVGLRGLAGVGLMIGGLVLAGWPRRGLPRGFPLWALALPLGAALARGIGQPLNRLGLMDLPSPYFATLVAATVSLGVLGVQAGLRKTPARRGARGLRLFLLSGVVNGLGILTLNAALHQGRVALVSPLVATAPLWSLALGVTLFRSETLGRRHLVIALLVFAGSVLIVTR